MTAPGIEVRGLSLHVGDRRLFDNLSFTVPGGQWVSLLGASGAGKTSLLRVMAGLAPATRGEVVASDGQPIQGRLAWMGQKDLLYPWLSVRDNVALGARLRGEKVDRARVAALLEQVELSSCADARPATLSGGMRQRAALARTLYEDRPIVLMDEPFSALGYPHPYADSDPGGHPAGWSHGGAYHPRSAGGLPVEPPPAGPLGGRRRH
ncbi:ABC transporter ATP-binding protein [Klebsiella aerogenes]|nr:ABC transporter ATP-binding protein [Klebsiella aerogenes]